MKIMLSILIFSFFVFNILIHKTTQNRILKLTSFLLICLCILAVCLHKVFITNYPFYIGVKISPNAAKWNMYINFDKFLYAWTLIFLLGVGEFFNNKKTNYIKLFYYALFSMLLIPIANLMGFIDFEPKINKYFLTFILNNIFFISFSEEVFFRGFMLNKLRIFFKNNNFLAILISNTVFALVHLPNIPFAILAFFAGIFYSKAYLHNSNILHSIFLHAFVNAIHFVFFTYPYKMIF